MHRVIDTITGTVINSQFRYALTDRTDISWISSCKTFNPGQHLCSCANIAQAIEPSDIGICFPNLEHDNIVASRLQIVNEYYWESKDDRCYNRVDWLVGRAKRDPTY